MKRFLIVARAFSGKHEECINRVKNFIENNGGQCTLAVNPCPDESEEELLVDDEVECIITVGGDGTIVRVAHNVKRQGVPIVGVNSGHLGYLCDMTTDNIERCLTLLLNDEYSLDERMMLEGGLSTTVNGKFRALNDIVVTSKSAGISVLNLTVTVNGIKLYNHNCDGLIVATPTGSTAYNLSANGPIVSPHSQLIILTPINPHTLNSRSIILAAEDTIEIEISSRYEGGEEIAAVIYDGVARQVLKNNDKLVVRKSKDTTKMVRLETASFLERIRVRMQEI